MSTNRTPEASSFDLFRLTKAKACVDLSPNTLRAYHKRGLKFYHQGRAIFVSKTELAEFIRTREFVPVKVHREAA